MDTWYQYRLVWSARPWVALIAVLGVVLIVGAVAGMIAGDALAVVFIPGLALLYVHHLVAVKASEAGK